MESSITDSKRESLAETTHNGNEQRGEQSFQTESSSKDFNLPPTVKAQPASAPTKMSQSALESESRNVTAMEDEAEGGTCAYEPSADFKGNIEVSNKLPSKKILDQCADLLVLDAEGGSRPFKELYSGPNKAQKQLIIFIRHFFCGHCQEYLRSLSSSITPDALLSLKIPTFITVIGCGRPELIRTYQELTGCTFPIYADPTRKLYDLLGMTRTWDLGPKKPEYIQTGILTASIQSIFQGLRTGSKALSGGDFKQVGGEFLFDGGEVVWCHRMRNTRDHTEIEELGAMLGVRDARVSIRKRWTSGIKGIGRRSSSWGRDKDRKSKSATWTVPERDRSPVGKGDVNGVKVTEQPEHGGAKI